MPGAIVITGTSRGFGKLCVERFAAEGWNVAATVRKNTDPAAHLSKTRKAFDGLAFPTRRRVYRRNRDGTTDRILAAITLDIDDITTA